jgi:hypothetical protein
MANNEKRKRLDQPARDTLSALDRLIVQEFNDSQPIQPDEFTLAQISDKLAENGKDLGVSSLQRRMNQLIKDGVVTMRKGAVNGKQAKIFKFV